MDHQEEDGKTLIDDADLDAVSGGQAAPRGGFDFSSADTALQQGNERAAVCRELGTEVSYPARCRARPRGHQHGRLGSRCRPEALRELLANSQRRKKSAVAIGPANSLGPRQCPRAQDPDARRAWPQAFALTEPVVVQRLGFFERGRAGDRFRASARTRAMSSSPLAPHPRSPEGMAGRNFSYSAKARPDSSRLGMDLASAVIDARTAGRESPSLLTRYRSTAAGSAAYDP